MVSSIFLLSTFQLGMYTLGIILDISGENFKQPEKQANLCNLFNSTLNSIPDMSEPLAYLTVVAMHHYQTTCENPVSSFSIEPFSPIYRKVLACIICANDLFS